MNTLLMRLAGPMQSWGTRSRFTDRDTGLEPSKSGVIGLICAALGRTRSEPVQDLAAMRMGVRVDHEGIHKVDFHTTMNILSASGKAKDRSALSRRHYLADADFLVGLESDDLALLESINDALANPHWPLSLGRKSFVPGRPVYIPDGVMKNINLEDALKSWPWCPPQRGAPPARLRVVLEPNAGESGAMACYDVPISFDTRTFRLRFVNITFWNTDELVRSKGDDVLCTSPA